MPDTSAPSAPTTPSQLTAALGYLQRGWRPVPLQAKGKKPLLPAWPTHTHTADELRDLWRRAPTLNVGLAMGHGFIDLEVDPRNGGTDQLLSLVELLGDLPPTLTFVSGGGGHHHLFRAPTGSTFDRPHARIRNILSLPHDAKVGLDCLGIGKQCVAPPSIHPNGTPYQWFRKLAPTTLPPGWAAALGLTTLATAPSNTTPSTIHGDAPDPLALMDARTPGATLDMTRDALAKVSPYVHHDEWIRVLMALHAQFYDTPDEDGALALAIEWSSGELCQEDTNGDNVTLATEQDIIKRWQSFHVRENGCTVGGQIFRPAEARGWRPPRPAPIPIRPQSTYTRPAPSLDGVTLANWEGHLLRDKDGEPVRSAQNTTIIMAFHPSLAGDVWWNEMAKAATTRRGCPWAFVDAEHPYDPSCNIMLAGRIARILTGKGSIPTGDAFTEAVRAAAKARPRHPLRDWLHGLVWDGVERMDTWLTVWGGVDDNPYVRAVGRKWLIGLAGRGASEGRYKMDNVLLIKGQEGLGKTTLAQILGGDYFASVSLRMDSDDMVYTLESSWVVELAEMTSVRRSDAESVKAMVTEDGARFRRKYAATAETVHHHHVFLGTTNEDRPAMASLGVRRWWVVEMVRRIDRDGLRQNRDQLIAEAMAAHMSGELPIIPDSMQSLHESTIEANTEDDHWQESVNEFLGTLPDGKAKLRQIAQGALLRDLDSMTGADVRRMTACLRVARWQPCTSHGVRWWRKTP